MSKRTEPWPTPELWTWSAEFTAYVEQFFRRNDK